MNKQKDLVTYRPEADKLIWYSSHSIDEAIKCLETLPSDYEVKIIKPDTDNCRFEISFRFNNAPFACGTLRRWEGTLTRMDFDGDFGRIKSPPKQEAKQSIETSSVIILLGLFGSILLIPVINIGALLLLGAFILYFIYIQQENDLVYQENTLLSEIKLRLESEGVITYSPEELSEKMVDAIQPEISLSENKAR